MTELKEFAYINNSLTTMAQSRLITIIANYIKVPQKKLREHLDKDRLKEDSVIRFNGLNSDLDDFYVASFKLQVDTLLYPKKFAKSQFLEQYTLAHTNAKTKNAIFVVYPSLMVLTNTTNVCYKANNEGVGGIFIHYPDHGLKYNMLVTVESFFRLAYPSPQSTNWLNEV